MQSITTTTFFVTIFVGMIIPSFSSSIITTTSSTHPQNFTCNSTKDCSAFFSSSSSSNKNKNKNNLNYVCTEAGRCSCLLGFEAQKISKNDKQETSNSDQLLKCSPIPCDQCYTVNMTCLGAIECRCLAGKVTQQGTVCELQYSKEDHQKPRKKLRKRVRIGGQQGGHKKKSSSSFATDLNRKTLFTLMAVGVIAVGMLIVAVVCFMGFKENAPYIWPEKYGKGKGGSGDKVKEGTTKKKEKKVVMKNDGKLKSEKSKIGPKSSVQAVSAVGSKSNFSAAQPTKSFAPQAETKSFKKNFSNSKSKQS